MTTEIRQNIAVLLKHTNANDVVGVDDEDGGWARHFAYPLVDNVSRIQYESLLYAMGVGDRRNPGAGSFGDLKLVKTGDNEADIMIMGRPGFPSYTLKGLRPNPAQARRHIVAWHNIRSRMNRMIAWYGVSGTAERLRELKVSVPEEVKMEADKCLGKLSAKALGGYGEDGKTILRYLFYMNGNLKNLWLGNSPINSGLPGIYKRTMDKINEAKSPEALVDLAKQWVGAPPSDSIDDTARRYAAMTILDIHEAFKEVIGEEEIEAEDLNQRVLNGLRYQADLALSLLEVDLQPGSPQEAQNLNQEHHGGVAALGYMMHGGAYDAGEVGSLFSMLLDYPTRKREWGDANEVQEDGAPGALKKPRIDADEEPETSDQETIVDETSDQETIVDDDTPMEVETSFHGGFGDEDASGLLPTESGGRGQQRERDGIINADEEVRAANLLGVNDCLIDAICAASPDRVGKPPSLGERANIRTVLGNPGEMLYATPEVVGVIRNTLRFRNRVVVHYPYPNNAPEIIGRDEGEEGSVLHIYYTDLHFTNERPNGSDPGPDSIWGDA